MIRIEASGKTIEEATEAAVAKAGVDRERLTIEVVAVPQKKGLFGLKMTEAVVAVMYEEIVEAPAVESRAKEILSEMLSKMGVDCEIEETVTDREILFNIVGDGVGVVIGRRGETLDALQYLLSLCINKGSEEYIKVTLDAENYREKREKTLQRLAKKLAAKVVESKRSVTLEAMNPNERRIIHSTLQDYKGVTTTSIGSEPNRRVVISSTEQKRGPRPQRGGRGRYPKERPQAQAAVAETTEE